MTPIDNTAELLAAAFVDDPLHVWALPATPEIRQRRLRWLLGAWLEQMGRSCEIDRVEAGVAVWRPPGVAAGLPRRDLLLSRLTWAPLRLGIPAVLRLREAGLDLERHEEADTGGRLHWTLELLAADPAVRGRGIGAVLVERGVARASAVGLPVYAVTHNPANVEWFRRRGFEVVDRRSLGKGTGPRVWALVREPKA